MLRRLKVYVTDYELTTHRFGSKFKYCFSLEGMTRCWWANATIKYWFPYFSIMSKNVTGWIQHRSNNKILILSFLLGALWEVQANFLVESNLVFISWSWANYLVRKTDWSTATWYLAEFFIQVCPLLSSMSLCTTWMPQKSFSSSHITVGDISLVLEHLEDRNSSLLYNLSCYNTHYETEIREHSHTL